MRNSLTPLATGFTSPKVAYAQPSDPMGNNRLGLAVPEPGEPPVKDRRRSDLEHYKLQVITNRKSSQSLLPPGLDISASRRDLGHAPSIKLDEGIRRFVAWYRDYAKI